MGFRRRYKVKDLAERIPLLTAVDSMVDQTRAFSTGIGIQIIIVINMIGILGVFSCGSFIGSVSLSIDKDQYMKAGKILYILRVL